MTFVCKYWSCKLNYAAIFQYMPMSISNTNYVVALLHCIVNERSNFITWFMAVHVTGGFSNDIRVSVDMVDQNLALTGNYLAL